jgi:hypothetical protein
MSRLISGILKAWAGILILLVSRTGESQPYRYRQTKRGRQMRTYKSDNYYIFVSTICPVIEGW